MPTFSVRRIAVVCGIVLSALIPKAYGGWAIGPATGSMTSPAALTLKSTGGQSRVLDNGSCYGACFSPDLREVAYVRNNDICIIGVDGSNPRTVKAGGMSNSGESGNTLSWCTNGYLYYSRGWTIYRYKADGSGSESAVHTSSFSGDGDRIRQLQVCRDGSRGASWGRPNGDGHAIIYTIGTPASDKRWSNHCMGAVSKSGTYFNTTYDSHTETGIFRWSDAPPSVTRNDNFRDDLGITPYRVLNRHSGGTIWYVRFSQCEEDYICWQEGSTGYVTRVSTGQEVGRWSNFVPQDFLVGDLYTGGLPQVVLVSPSDGLAILSGSSVTLSAQVTAGNMPITEVRFEVNGTPVATLTSAPWEASWIASVEGRVVVTAVATDASGQSVNRSAAITVGGLYAYPDSIPHRIPGRIEAEHFDYGGQGLAYHDADQGNTRGTFRSSEDVDVAEGATGRFVTSTQAGEWLRYSVDVAATASYTVAVSAANGSGSGAFHIEIDGVDVTGPITGSTGGYAIWQTFTRENIHITAGRHVMTLAFDQTGHIVDYIDVIGPAQTITITQPAAGSTYATGDSLIVVWSTDQSQVDDVIIERSLDDGESWQPLMTGSIAVGDSQWGRFGMVIPAAFVAEWAMIRVSEYGGSRNDIAGPFTITAATQTARWDGRDGGANHPSGWVRATPEQVSISPVSGATPFSLWNLQGRMVTRGTATTTQHFRVPSGVLVVRLQKGATQKVVVP